MLEGHGFPSVSTGIKGDTEKRYYINPLRSPNLPTLPTHTLLNRPLSITNITVTHCNMPAEEATTQVASFMGLSSTSKASIDGPQFTAVSGVSGVSTAEPQQKSPVSEPAETVEQSLHKKRAFISNQQKHSEIRQQYKEVSFEI